MRIVPIFISGLVGGACSIAFSYGVASLSCGSASRSADTVCQVRSFGRALDSWKFGFLVGGLVGFIWSPRHQLIPRFQPFHLSATSLIILSIFFYFIRILVLLQFYQTVCHQELIQVFTHHV